jgi:hypothetical protein
MNLSFAFSAEDRSLTVTLEDFGAKAEAIVKIDTLTKLNSLMAVQAVLDELVGTAKLLDAERTRMAS